MKFTQIPTNTFKEMQLNAGVILSTFDTSTATISADSILAATSGGISFEANPEYKDMGDGIDNCPQNMMELKKLEKWEAKMSGTMISISPSIVKSLLGAADVASEKVTPRNDLTEEDFSDIWWVGDYSEYNGDTNGGFVAIHLMNALSTGGFKLQSADKEKGEASFEYTAHYSIDAQDTVPFEIYVKAGTAET